MTRTTIHDDRQPFADQLSGSASEAKTPASRNASEAVDVRASEVAILKFLQAKLAKKAA